jgi:hypothetical protein
MVYQLTSFQNFFFQIIFIKIQSKWKKYVSKNGKPRTRGGMPDGLFSNKKSQFGQIIEVLRLKNVDIFYGHLEYFKEIWDIL